MLRFLGNGSDNLGWNLSQMKAASTPFHCHIRTRCMHALLPTFEETNTDMAIDTNKLEQALAAAFADFMTAFTAFDESRINTSPTPEQWTPAQVTTHIILATDGVPDHTSKPSDREADVMLARIRPWWEDLNQKFKAPEQLKPDNAPRTKQQVLTELNRVRSKDLQLITTQNLTELCLDFEMPGIGYLTRYEWLWFIEMHLKRHTFQLRNMLKQHNAEFDL